MVAYFKRENNLFMIVGAVLGFAAVLAYYGGKILGTEDQFVRLAMLSGGTFLGIIFSRILSAGYANRKLREMYQKLYVETKPQEFIDLFTPRLAQVPDNLAEFMDGRVRLSFAEEALGHFDRALELLADLRPEELKLHTLTASSLVVNQRAGIFLLEKDTAAAAEQIEDLKELRKMAEKRAATLGANLAQCIRLGEARIRAAEGAMTPEDETYLLEEIRLSTNVIHQKEMQLALAEGYFLKERPAEAEALLKEITAERAGLWTEEQADRYLDGERPVSAKTEAEEASGTQEMTERGDGDHGQKEEHAEQ